MDPDAKLFYRKLIDFGPGVGMREAQRKYDEEMRKEEERRRMMNEDIGMLEDKNLNFLQDFMIAKGYNKLIPEGLRDKYKREADIDKYLKNMEKLRQRGILS